MNHLSGQKHKLERKLSTTKRKVSPRVRFLDKLTFVAGIAGPFTVLPQIWSIFSTHSTAGVSLSTWLLLTIVTLPWVFYGFVHKDKSIIVSFILWEVANLAVVVGVLIYS